MFKPTNPYIIIADDDIFMRVPLYLQYLEVLPQEKLNMGRAVGYPKDFSDEITWHTIGYASTLSRDVVKEIVNYKPLRKLVKSPIKFRNFESYIDFRALNEDIMVGEVIRNKLKFEGLLTVDMQDCRYVMHMERTMARFVDDSPELIVLNHVRTEEYAWLKNMLPIDNTSRREAPIAYDVDKSWKEFSCTSAEITN